MDDISIDDLYIERSDADALMDRLKNSSKLARVFLYAVMNAEIKKNNVTSAEEVSKLLKCSYNNAHRYLNDLVTLGILKATTPPRKFIKKRYLFIQDGRITENELIVMKKIAKETVLKENNGK